MECCSGEKYDLDELFDLKTQCSMYIWMCVSSCNTTFKKKAVQIKQNYRYSQILK